MFTPAASKNLDLYQPPRAAIVPAILHAAWRYRWELVPIYAVIGIITYAWITIGVRLSAGWWWLAATVAVTGICVAVSIYRLTPGYERVYATTTAVLGIAWTVAAHLNPANPSLYGVAALATPLLGLAWWTSGTFRSIKLAQRFRQKFARIAAQAGYAGARMIKMALSSVGQIVTVKLPPGQSADSLNPRTLESWLDLRPGAIKVEPSKTSTRMAKLHIAERDPWKVDIEHPAFLINNGTGKAA